MPHAVRLLTAAALALALAGCATKGPALPPEVETVELPVSRYVEVTERMRELLAPCPIAEGPLREAVHVARLRKEQLQACNGDKAAVLQLLEDAAAQNRAR